MHTHLKGLADKIDERALRKVKKNLAVLWLER